MQFSLSPLKTIAKKVGTHDSSPVVSQSGMTIKSGSCEKSAASTQDVLHRYIFTIPPLLTAVIQIVFWIMLGCNCKVGDAVTSEVNLALFSETLKVQREANEVGMGRISLGGKEEISVAECSEVTLLTSCR